MSAVLPGCPFGHLPDPFFLCMQPHTLPCRLGMLGSCVVVRGLAWLAGFEAECYDTAHAGLPPSILLLMHLCGVVLVVEQAKGQRKLW